MDRSMNYVDEIAVEIYAIAENDPFPNTELKSFELYRIYAVLALSSGITTTCRNVHDAWSAWSSSIDVCHPSLVPFEELALETQVKDIKYRDAIIVVARGIIAKRQHARGAGH